MPDKKSLFWRHRNTSAETGVKARIHGGKRTRARGVRLGLMMLFGSYNQSVRSRDVGSVIIYRKFKATFTSTSKKARSSSNLGVFSPVVSSMYRSLLTSIIMDLTRGSFW